MSKKLVSDDLRFVTWHVTVLDVEDEYIVVIKGWM